MERGIVDKKDYGILNERGYKNMEAIDIFSIVIAGLVAITYMVTQKKVKKHVIVVSFGKLFQLKTETEFAKEA